MNLVSKQLERIVNEKLEAETRRLNKFKHEAEAEMFERQLKYVQDKFKAMETDLDLQFNDVISRNEVEEMHLSSGGVPLLQEVSERCGKRPVDAILDYEEVGLDCDLIIGKKRKF